ncbi:MAG: exodeoxyribonuclease VII large subunit [Candidatus Aureabacteria bacterium]|nr:exodeoxyribonuclease VII large subunit [Candidatus Auribacterota bacterium]
MNDDKKIFKVIELTRLIKASLESQFYDVWIEGEISNLKRPKSGHMYLTLKDEFSQIQAVRFRSNNDPLCEKLKDGDKVKVFGSVGVYERSGQYQIYIKKVEKVGIGDLQKRFEELKEKLKKEGLFENKYKKAIPVLPRTIGIITSPTGAAIKDMLNVLDRRFSNVHVILFPVKVQGVGAAAEIASALDALNRMKEADVIIIGRGGGSLEDLWAFNEEIVARAVFRSVIPVISAVGHEIDYTISDFTSDLRAETPTAAAELVLKRKQDLFDIINRNKEKLIQSLTFKVSGFRARVERCRDHYALKTPEHMISQFRQNVDDMEWKIKSIIERIVSRCKNNIIKEKEKLKTLSPLNILKRGYSITQDFNTKNIIKDVKLLKKNMLLATKIYNGVVVSTVEEVERI